MQRDIDGFFFADKSAGVNEGVAPLKKWFVEYLDQSTNWKPVVTATPCRIRLGQTSCWCWREGMGNLWPRSAENLTDARGCFEKRIVDHLGATLQNARLEANKINASFITPLPRMSPRIGSSSVSFSSSGV